MLLVLRIVTIIVAIAGLVGGVVLIVAGLNDEPAADWDAVMIGAGICLYYLADLYLLYRSYKRKHIPTHWVAFLLGVLPAIIVLVILLILKLADQL